MKHIFLLCLLWLCHISGRAQVSSYSFAPINDTINVPSIDSAMSLTYGLIPRSHISTGYLFDKGYWDVKSYYANGTLNDSSFNMFEFYFLQNNIRASYFRPDSFPGYLAIDSMKNRYIDDNNILPFGIINMQGDYIKASAFENNYMTVSSYRFVENSSTLSDMYAQRRVFCVSPLNIEVYTMEPSFVFSPDYIISNSADTLVTMQVDLNDALGFRTVYMNTPFSASYASGGFKQFTARFIYSNGDTLYSRSELNVIDQDVLARSSGYTYQEYDDLYRITFGDGNMPNLLYYNIYFTDPMENEFDNGNGNYTNNAKYAEVGVWYGCGNDSNKIRKPFIIFGGYNPKDGKSLTWNGHGPASWYNQSGGPILALDGWRGPLYETYNGFYTDFSKNPSNVYGDNTNHLLDNIRNEGYDILIVRFHDGIGYLQNNAWLAIGVLNELNQRLLNETDNITNPGADLDPDGAGYPNSTKIKRAKHEITLGGWSAGAMTGRLALTWMEANYNLLQGPGHHHRTKLWIGVDHETQGSNTPIGQQMLMDYLESVFFIANSPADLMNSYIAKKGLTLIKHPGIATQNSLYHINSLSYAGSSNWNTGHDATFDHWFYDLIHNTDVYTPSNLIGYPTFPYRISASQGNANGNSQLNSSTVQMIDNVSPTQVCFGLYSLFNNYNSTIGPMLGITLLPGVKVMPYREAHARNLTSWNDNAFSCNLGLSLNTLFFSWYINIGHWKYHQNNHIIDNIFNSWRPYDSAPASTLPSHKLLAKNFQLSSDNYYMATIGNCNYAGYSTYQDGFAPTVSGLDLHASGNNNLPRYPDLSLIPGNVSGGLNLMMRNKYSNVFDPSPHNDFGYPHLTYGSSHYDHTPFDAIWANTRNDVNYDDNTMHVEDPNPWMGEFLLEEIAPQTLYLSNRTIAGYTLTVNSLPYLDKYYADFEARNSILAGNQDIYQHDPISANWYLRQRTAPGDFVVGLGSIVNMRANNANGTSSITLGAGFSAKNGSIFRAYVYNDPNGYNCNFGGGSGSRSAYHADSTASHPLSRPILSSKKAQAQFRRQPLPGASDVDAFIQAYPNPTNGQIQYSYNKSLNFTYTITDVTGSVLETGNLSECGGRLNLGKYSPGVYFVTVTSGTIAQTDRILLQ